MLNNSQRTRIYDQQGLNQSKAWEREKSKKQTRKLLRLIILVFVVIIFLTAILQIPGIISRVSKPFGQIPAEMANKTKVDLNFRTNILLASVSGKKLVELGFLSFAKGDRKLILVKLDPNYKVVGVKADYSFNDLFVEGKSKYNIDHLESSMISSVGYPMDGYIVLTNGQNLVDPEKLEKLIDNFYSIGFFFNLKASKDYLDKNLKTNISLNNANDLVWFAKNLTPDRINFIDLRASKDPEGYLDTQSVGNKLGLLLSDPLVAKEGAAVEIVNASSVEGVGNIFKLVIANLGGNVLNTAKAEGEGETEVITKNKNSQLAKKLSEITAVKIKIVKDSELNTDIKLIIGDDYAKFFDF